MSRGELSWADFLRFKASQTVYKFTVVTGSMAPLIPVGATVVVESAGTPSKGDIIVFWQADKLICHILWHENRLMQDGGEKVYVTRPLTGQHLDISIRSQQILGVVISHTLSWSWRWRLYWRDFKRYRRS